MYKRFTLAACAASCLSPSFSLAADQLETVVVTATRQATRTHDLLSDTTVIGRDEISQAPQSFLADLLAAQPGVQLSANGSPGATSTVRLRGASGEHTLVLIDGQRVGSATQGSASWSRLPLSQIERIEILRGPASSLYGSDAIGGVVQIFTRRGEGTPRLGAELGGGSYGTSSANGNVSGSLGGLRYSLGAATLRTDGFNSIRNPANRAYNPDADGFSNKSANVALSYDMASGHEIGLSAFHSDGRNRYDAGTTAVSRARQYENVLAVQSHAAYLKNKVTGNWASTLRIGTSTDDSTNYSNAVMTDIFRTDQNQVSWQHDIRLAVGQLLLAWEGLTQNVSGTSNYAIKERRTASWLVGWGGKLGDHRLQTSLRRDNSSQYGAKTTGALAWGYQFSERWRGHASYGTAFRAPTFNDLYFPLSFGFVGNPNLKPEFARSREVALYYESGNQRASAVWYLNKVSDLISWSGVTSPINIGTAQLEGITLSYANRYGSFDVDGSFDHLNAKDASSGRQLGRRARSQARLGLGQTLADWQWRTELQAVGSRFDDDANLRHLGAYSLVNLQASRALNSDWSLFVRANNLFDKKYETAADFAMPGANLFVGLRYASR
ncbi:MAG: TonB-dependent receptor [Sulfuritalea sp.]|nr:TonB-dependent receptor [Sulfuritalea sp.]